MCMTHPKIGVSDGGAVGSPHTANKDSTSAYTGLSYSSSLAWEAQKILLQRNLTHLTDVLLKERGTFRLEDYTLEGRAQHKVPLHNALLQGSLKQELISDRE